jgi:hypothetical protein
LREVGHAQEHSLLTTRPGACQHFWCRRATVSVSVHLVSARPVSVSVHPVSACDLVLVCYRASVRLFPAGWHIENRQQYQDNRGRGVTKSHPGSENHRLDCSDHPNWAAWHNSPYRWAVGTHRLGWLQVR